MLDWHGVLNGAAVAMDYLVFTIRWAQRRRDSCFRHPAGGPAAGLRLGGRRAGAGLVAAWVCCFRIHPLLVQLLLVLAAWNLLPLAVRGSERRTPGPTQWVTSGG